MGRYLNEISYFEIYGEYPYTTYFNMIERGFISRYFDKMEFDDFADMVIHLSFYFKAHGKREYITELSEVEYARLYNNYVQFKETYNNEKKPLD